MLRSSARSIRHLPALALLAATACGGTETRPATRPVTAPPAAPVTAPPAAPVTAQPHQEAVTELATRAFDEWWTFGLAIALVGPDGSELYGFGRTAVDGAAVTPDTLFEIGSVTKVFTAVLLADAVVAGELALDTPARELAPPGMTLPELDGQPIRLLHLATHTSGLPRLPGNLRWKSWRTPYAEYTEDKLIDFLAGYRLADRPGARYEYSNLGAGLLGFLLARHFATDYETLVRRRITEPLGMTDTAIALSEEQRARMAKGHDLGGKLTPNWDMKVLAGAGGLRSTARDMARFIAANLSPPSSRLGQALALSHVARVPRPGGQVALGWHLGLGDLPDAIWHNGGTGGFHAFIGFDPTAGVGVVMLANQAQPALDQLGVALLHLMRGEPHALAPHDG